VPRDVSLADSAYGDYGVADLVRAAQLRQHLVSVFGPPDTLAVPRDRRRGREMLRAWLFSAR
jgi:hypothetical protein